MAIKAEEIPASALQSVARKAYASIVDYFDDPENQRKFEEWKKKREKTG